MLLNMCPVNKNVPNQNKVAWGNLTGISSSIARRSFNGIPCNIHFSSLIINRLRRRKYKRLDGHTHVHWLREQMMRSMFCDLGLENFSLVADKCVDME